MDYWIEVAFQKAVKPSAVVIHLSSDGRLDPISPNDTITISLKSTMGQYQKLDDNVELSCSLNPILVKVPKEKLHKFLTQAVRIEFTSSYLSIAAVGLRYPVQTQCGRNQYFDKKTQQCVDQTQDHSSKRLCPKLNLKHSNATCSEDGQRCKIKCHIGYERKQQREEDAVCENGIWKNSEPCFAIDCGMPKIENTVSISKYFFFYILIAIIFWRSNQMILKESCTNQGMAKIGKGGGVDHCSSNLLILTNPVIFLLNFYYHKQENPNRDPARYIPRHSLILLVLKTQTF